MAAAGVQVAVVGRAWVDFAVTAAWLLAVLAGFALLRQHTALWPWLAAGSGAGALALGLLNAQPEVVALGGLTLAAGLALSVARRPAWVQVAAESGLAVLPVAVASVLLANPERARLGTWMVPVVLCAVPLANLAWAAGAAAARAAGLRAQAADLPAFLERQGYSPRGVRRVLLAAAAAQAVVAVGLSRIVDPFAANLGLAACVVGAVAAARPRAVQRAGWLPALIYTYALGTLLAFVLSLHTGFLDFLFNQTLSDYQGWDYFLLPRAWECLRNGASIYNPYPTPEQCDYGPWATPFVLHPFMALFPGAALHALPPWTSYGVFVAATLGMLLVVYALFARLTDRPLSRSLIFLALFANWPLYLLLWLGQTHIFTVLAYGLVQFWLLRQAGLPDGRYAWLLTAGLLVSLLSKPMVLVFMPALVLSRLARSPALAAAVIYVAISAVFLLVPALNPVGLRLDDLLPSGSDAASRALRGNLYHWGNIVAVSGRLNTNHRDIHVLSTLLNVVLPEAVVLWFNRLFLGLVVLWVTWLAALRRPAAVAAQSLALSGTLLIASYYLTYTFAFEHQYPTLAIVPAVFIVLLPWLQDEVVRRYLLLGLAAFVPLLLPTIYRLVVAEPVRDIVYDFSAESLEQMTIYKTFRVLPVLLMFIFNFLALRRLRLQHDTAGAAPPAGPLAA